MTFYNINNFELSNKSINIYFAKIIFISFKKYKIIKFELLSKFIFEINNFILPEVISKK